MCDQQSEKDKNVLSFALGISFHLFTSYQRLEGLIISDDSFCHLVIKNSIIITCRLSAMGKCAEHSTMVTN